MVRDVRSGQVAEVVRSAVAAPEFLEQEFASRLQEAYHFELARREARRLIDAEAEPDVDLDALYLDRESLKHLPQPEALIPGVLPRHAYGVLRGRDQSFKSFVALEWALTLACGRYWGLTQVEQVPVLYIAGEGAWGLAARIEAWELAKKTEVPSDWFTVRQAALNLHHPGPAFDHLLEHVEARGYGLVVVDTLRRVSGAADGNGSEMGAVIDNIDRIKRVTAGGSVLVVAHTDKGDNDSRGYSGIEDDADFVWHAKREAYDLELSLTKMKDGPDGITTYLKAWPSGSSLVLHPATKPAATRETTESENKLLSTLREIFPNGAHATALLDTAGIPKATFYRALKKLEDRSLIANEGSETRPRWVARSLDVSQDGIAPHLPVIAGKSQEVSPKSQEVSPVSRPLGSETNETNGRDSGDLTDEQRAILGHLDATPSPNSEPS